MSLNLSNHFWTDISEPVSVYPWLAQNESCDVCIIGGGITGSLCALYFAQSGINTVLVTREGIGYGATDTMCGACEVRPFGGVSDLAGKIGKAASIAMCRANREAIGEIEDMIKAFSDDCGFYKTDSLLYSNKSEFNTKVKKEYLMLLHNGFDIELITPEEVGELFSLDAKESVILKNSAIVVNPYKICQNAVSTAAEKGAGIYEYTEIDTVSPQKNGIELLTSAGKRIKAKVAIFTAGVQNKSFIKEETERCTGFSSVSGVIEATPGWYNKSVITCCDDKESTAYMTFDNRIVMYGMETFLNPDCKLCAFDAVNSFFTKRCDVLEAQKNSMFTAIDNIDAKYFCSSVNIIGLNGQLFAGGTHGYPHCYFTACGGKNGIINSQIAAKTLLRLYQTEHV